MVSLAKQREDDTAMRAEMIASGWTTDPLVRRGYGAIIVPADAVSMLSDRAIGMRVRSLLFAAQEGAAKVTIARAMARCMADKWLFRDAGWSQFSEREQALIRSAGECHLPMAINAIRLLDAHEDERPTGAKRVLIATARRAAFSPRLLRFWRQGVWR